jgi:hypothetical protein
MQVDSGGNKAGCFFFVNFVILKIWQIFPKKIPELVKFILEKKDLPRFSQFGVLHPAKNYSN